MDRREQKGLEIAATKKVARKGDSWIVPSTSSNSKYKVRLHPTSPHCTCPDFEQRSVKCKHIFAVEYTLQREQSGKVQPPIAKPARPTYKQQWTAYNAAQIHEKARFQVLLHELCRGIDEPVQERGRPRMLYSDMLFSAAFKVYSTFSGRRFSTDLREAHAKGYISHVPHFNIVFRYLQSNALTPYLNQLIEQSSLPLRDFETDFAVDATGLSTDRFLRWISVRSNDQVDKREWLKLHLVTGTRTHIVGSVIVTDGHANDYPFYRPLIDAIAKNGFQLKEVSADKGYIGAENLRITLAHGAMPYIPFKVNANPDGKSTVWQRLFHFYHYHQEEFLLHYHKRSNVETVFSMIKAKFGDRIRSKMRSAQINEALCKVLCHNLCVLIQGMHELNLDPVFWRDEVVAGQLVAPERTKAHLNSN
jgi:transposase